MLMMVVRHAHAGIKGSWDGPDVLRPLSLAGRRQAEGLVLRLEDYPVERILCSPTVRCYQTILPLARQRFVRIDRVAALAVEASLDEVLAVFRDRRLHDAVFCTHGETIGRLLTQLVADGMVVEEPLQWPKGSTWLLERDGQRQVRARYLPPLELDWWEQAADSTRRAGIQQAHPRPPWYQGRTARHGGAAARGSDADARRSASTRTSLICGPLPPGADN